MLSSTKSLKYSFCAQNFNVEFKMWKYKRLGEALKDEGNTL